MRMISTSRINTKYYVLGSVLAWTALIVSLIINDINQNEYHFKEGAKARARTAFNKDQSFRFWATNHGGVYVPVDERTPPNPHLKDLEERDIVTPSGKKLTLMNPAYMIRQMNDESSDLYGISGHITSLNLIREMNAPDEWEKSALESFEKGTQEVLEFTEVKSEPVLRLMQPMYIQSGCLKCHGDMGYKIGDIRGGIGVTVPLQSMPLKKSASINSFAYPMVALWFMGLVAILWGGYFRDKQRTQRQQFTREIQESQQNFFAFTNQSIEGISVADLDGKYTFVNPAFCKMVGWSENELLGMTVFDVTADQDDTSTFKRTKTVEEGVPVTVQLVRKNRTEFLAEVTGKVLTIGNKKSVLGTIRDVTKQKKAEQDKIEFEKQILHTQKLESLGVLAGGIAHDFNNILMGILGYADLALTSLDPIAPAREFVQGINDSSRKAADLVKQMLAYSGKGKFSLEPIDLNHLIEDTIQMLNISISKNAVLRYNYSKDPVYLEGDPAQIRQIIMNMVINASDAVGKTSGVVAITTGSMYCDREYIVGTGYEAQVPHNDQLQEGMYVILEISDTGIGMSKDTISRIFEPFYTTKFTGRGLGLSAVMGIVNGHKGMVKIYSEESKGTTFKVLFPLYEDTIRVSSIDSSLDKMDDDWQGQGTFLIADDEEAVRSVGKHMIQSLGYDVLTANDGQQAIEVFTEHADEIVGVLLDLTMPHKDGAEVFAEIRKLKPEVKVILSSGYNEQDVTQRFVGKGLAGFIQKPYVSKELVKKIREVMS